MSATPITSAGLSKKEKENYIKILAWSQKISKRVKVVREEVVNGRGSCSSLVFYRLREVGHVRVASWRGRAVQRSGGTWGMGGRGLRPHKKVVACLVVQPSIRPAIREAGGRGVC